MSEPPRSEPNPNASRQPGGALKPGRRKVGPAKIALAAVLATLITAITFGVLSLILWGLAPIFH